ncbi:PH domain-containing protein [Clostridium sp. P21]|uniref:PH domain-containing protein n=1 Tax=Clostridium muellerianum TaxID=2716538 RepID=A0A7Y0EHM9_9CLOT|nr:PH domain-containing protein [Clostridium muellerianum]NMM63654.1 PH domain-containing protein [Clostridium muellerianum]
MKYNKQHPYFFISKIISSLKEYIISLLILIGAVISKGKNGKIIFLAIALIVLATIVTTIISWKNNVYSFDESGIHMKEGVISRKSRYIPKDKIHTLDIDSKFVQRLFGVVTLKIDTAGGGKEAEVRLILSKKEAENIRKILFSDNIKQNQEAESVIVEEKQEKVFDESIKYKASVTDLIITAITSKYIMGGMLFIFVLYDKINNVIPKSFKSKMDNFENKSAESIMAYKSLQLILVIIIAVVLITFIISIITTVITYYDFTIKRNGNKISVTYGLFDKKSVIVPIYRIQSISIVEGILKKPFNAVSINIESIGYGKEKGESTVLCPLLKKSKIDKFFAEVLTEIKPEFQFSYSSNKSIMGYLIRASIIPVIITIFITYKFKYGFFSLLILPFFFLLGYYRQRNAAICIKENELIMQFRRLAKHIVIIPKKNIQSSTKSQNIFQKRNNLINIKAAVQGEIAQTEYTIKGMNNEEFTKLQQWLFNI